MFFCQKSEIFGILFTMLRYPVWYFRVQTQSGCYLAQIAPGYFFLWGYIGSFRDLPRTFGNPLLSPASLSMILCFPLWRNSQFIWKCSCWAMNSILHTCTFWLLCFLRPFLFHWITKKIYSRFLLCLFFYQRSFLAFDCIICKAKQCNLPSLNLKKNGGQKKLVLCLRNSVK